MKTREFIKKFFTFHHSSINEEGKILHITLNPDSPDYVSLANELGGKEFHLAFDIKEVTAGIELITVGNPLLDRIHDFLRKEGHKAAIELPKKYHTTKKEARKKVIPLNKISYQLTQKQSTQEEIFFRFKTVYFSEISREEELFEEGINTTFFPVPKRSEAWIKEGKELPLWTPVKHLSELYEKALARVSERVKVKATHLEKQLWEEMKQAATRLDKYYHHQLSETSTKDLMQQDIKDKTIQKERDQHFGLLAEKYQLQVNLSLLGYFVLKFPIQQFCFHFPKGKFTLSYNLFTEQWEELHCQKCQERYSEYFFSEEGKAFCAKCVSVCTPCNKVVEQLSHCEVCSKKACPTCLTSCVECNQIQCPEHLVSCSFCEQKSCTNCHLRCMLCSNSFGCSSHFISFEEDFYCESCLFTCRSCQLLLPQNQKKKCLVCGQNFCRACFRICKHCQHEFCSIHQNCHYCGELYE